jgi:tetratricopeptide (TPR) repeat protein
MVLWIVALLTAQGMAAQNDPDPVAQATRLVESGKLSEARELLKQIPDPSTEALHLSGVVAYRLRDYPAAIQALLRASAKEAPASGQLRESLLLLGQSYFLLAKATEAVGPLEKAAAAGVRSNELFYMLGIGYIQSNHPDKARAAMASLFAVRPDSAAAHLLTAQMMLRQEFDAAAVTELGIALKMDPELAGAHYLLGQIAVFRGEVDRGIEEFERELAINPNSSMAYYKMGDALMRREEWDRAISFLQRSVWINPDFSGPYILLGKAYLRKKDYSNAEGMLRQSIRFDPQNQSAFYLLGQTLIAAGKPEEGRKMLERSMELRKAGVE